MKKTKTVKIYKSFILVVVFLFLAIITKLCYIVLSPKVDGINLTEFASNRNTVKEKIVAERGTIYDSLGNTLAVNVNSYTVIAYLDESRTTDKDNPEHVVDKEKTAHVLNEVLGIEYGYAMDQLSKDLYQVYFGPGGNNISEMQN